MKIKVDNILLIKSQRKNPMPIYTMGEWSDIKLADHIYNEWVNVYVVLDKGVLSNNEMKDGPDKDNLIDVIKVSDDKWNRLTLIDCYVCDPNPEIIKNFYKIDLGSDKECKIIMARRHYITLDLCNIKSQSKDV